MIFGGIGSGKSSLFYSMMGEMNPFFREPSPKLNINGSAFFVSQKPWLLNMSVKDNIILDRPFDREKFNKAVYMAALNTDLDIFDEREERVITEGAANLSGGQKTRVALARAFYQE